MSFWKEYLPFYKRNLKVAVPVMFSQLGQAVVQLADTMMVGQLGTRELAAASFAGAIFLIGLVFALGISLGSTPIVGSAYSKGEHRHAASIFQNSILFDLIAVGIICLIMYSVSFFMDRMGQPEEILSLAIPYYRILVFSLPPFLLFQAFKQFMEGIGDTKRAMYITIVANLINIGLNYLLIFGKLGFPELGLYGAGIATLISRILMPVFYFILFKLKPSLWRYFYFFKKNEFSRTKLKRLSSIGLPIGFQMFIEASAFSLSAVMVGWFGAISLASHQIAVNLSSLTFMIVCGIASATTIRVSHQFGAGDFISLRKAGFASMHLVICFSLIAAMFLIFLRYKIPFLFSQDPLVIDMAAMLLVMAGIYQLADGLQVVALGALRGLADVKYPMLIAVVCYTLINLPVGYFFGVVLNLEAIGVWMGFIFGLNMAAIFLITRFIRTSGKLIHQNC